MHVDAALIIEVAALLAALIAIGTAALRVVKWIQQQDKQSRDIERIKKEQYIMIQALVACLEGLRQQGCDGAVTKALSDLRNHLNEQAHDQGQDV